MYIVGFKHNGCGIDWLREPITVVSNQHIKDAEREAGPEADAILRQPGQLHYKQGKPPYFKQLVVKIRFIKP